MTRYWRTVAPPLDVMAAAFMGWKPPINVPSATGGPEQRGNLDELAAMFAGGTIQ